MSTLPPMADAVTEVFAPTDFPTNDGNFDVSVCLFACIGIMMMIIHQLNSGDPDIKKVSWEVINKSICTLTGVLISTSWGGFLEWATGAKDTVPVFYVNLVAFAAWFMLMHIALANVAGHTERESVADFKYNLHFWSPLISIIGGCSGMKVWASLQIIVVQMRAKDQHLAKEERILVAFGFVLIHMCFHKVLHIASRTARKIKTSADGVVDEFEKVWMKEVQSCEDNVDTMSLAFLIIQCVRFELTGHLPLATGLNPPGVVPDLALISCLTFSSAIFVCLFSLSVYIEAKTTTHTRMKSRVKLVLKNCTGFCWLYAGTWYAQHYVGTKVIGACIQAAVTTAGCFLIMYLIDYFKDLDCTDDIFDKQLQALYQPIAVLIGFSWKLAFAGSLKEITTDVHIFPQPVQTAILTACLCMVIIPGWRWYILPVLFPPETKPVAAKKVKPAHGEKHKKDQEALRQALLMDT